MRRAHRSLRQAGVRLRQPAKPSGRRAARRVDAQLAELACSRNRATTLRQHGRGAESTKKAFAKLPGGWPICRAVRRAVLLVGFAGEAFPGADAPRNFLAKPSPARTPPAISRRSLFRRGRRRQSPGEAFPGANAAGNLPAKPFPARTPPRISRRSLPRRGRRRESPGEAFPGANAAGNLPAKPFPARTPPRISRRSVPRRRNLPAKPSPARRAPRTVGRSPEPGFGSRGGLCEAPRSGRQPLGRQLPAEPTDVRRGRLAERVRAREAH